MMTGPPAEKKHSYKGPENLRSQPAYDVLMLHSLCHEIIKQRITASRLPPPAQTLQQGIQGAQVAGDTGRQRRRLKTGRVKSGVQGVLMQIQSRHGRVQPQRFPPLPLAFIEQPVDPAGHLQRLQGVLQAGQVVLR